MATSFLEKTDDVLRVLQQCNYPYGIEFEVYRSMDRELYKVDCTSCRKLGIAWTYIIDAHTIMTVKYPEEWFGTLRQRMVQHAEGHGSDVARSLIEKFVIVKEKITYPPGKATPADFEREQRKLCKEPPWKVPGDWDWKEMDDLLNDANQFEEEPKDWKRVGFVGRQIEKEND